MLSRALENFLELLLVFLGIISFGYIFDWLIETEVTYTLGVTFGVIFILQTILLFVRWAKIDTKKYVAEKIILMSTILLVLVFIIIKIFPFYNSIEELFSLILLGLSLIAIVAVMYLSVIFLLSNLKKIINSTAYEKWVNGLLIMFVCAIICIVYACQKERMIWLDARRYGGVHEYQFYLEKYPNGKYAEDALWYRARYIDTPEAYDKYFKKYPNGKYGRKSN
jgi:hypothetical protein